MVPRRIRFKLALLLALMLPMQGFSAADLCAPSHAGAAAIEHHCDPATSIAQHHGCGSCCAVAMAATPLRWAAPRMPSPEVSSATLLPAPTVIPDRLDRPPRLPS
jgi:hypothetical protein